MGSEEQFNEILERIEDLHTRMDKLEEKIEQKVKKPEMSPEDVVKFLPKEMQDAFAPMFNSIIQSMNKGDKHG